ncbi:MAG: hypothetical protein GY719_01065 [bacterium]|nr:hypothetical protein [bacterium]
MPTDDRKDGHSRALLAPCVALRGTLARRRRCGVLPWLAAAALAASTTTAEPLAAAEVTVYLSSEAVPYRQAAEGLERRLGAGHSIRVKSMPEPQLEVDLAPDVDAVVAVGTAAAVWLHRRLPDRMPWVYCMVADPAGLGLTGRPAPSGVSTDVPLEAQLELIGVALPATRSVGMLFRTGSGSDQDRLRSAAAVEAAGWQLEAVNVDQHESFAGALRELFERDVDVIWTQPAPEIYNPATVRSLLLAALRRRVPVFGYSTPFVRAGSLLGIGLDAERQGEQAAEILEDVLRPAASRHGAGRAVDPSFSVVVNLMVADKLDVELPPQLLRRAHKITGSDR